MILSDEASNFEYPKLNRIEIVSGKCHKQIITQFYQFGNSLLNHVRYKLRAAKFKIQPVGTQK
jgi:hypothetical protein